MQWTLDTHLWLGKAVGFACAMLWLPTDPVWLPLGLIGGIALGHVYDSWQSRERDTNLSPLRGSNSSATHQLQFLFTAAGRISKASGRVAPAHINCTEQLIKSLGLNQQHRAQAIEWFQQGKAPQTPFAQLAKRCLHADQATAQMRTAVAQCLCDFAVIEPSKECVEELKRLAGLLGFASGRIGQLFGEAHSRRATRREQPQRERTQTNTRSTGQGQTAGTMAAAPSAAVVAAYRYLDLPQDTPLEQTKKTYRRLISRYHPDRLGPSASSQEVSHAQRKMVELRDALETIEAHLQRS